MNKRFSIQCQLQNIMSSIYVTLLLCALAHFSTALPTNISNICENGNLLINMNLDGKNDSSVYDWAPAETACWGLERGKYYLQADNGALLARCGQDCGPYTDPVGK